MIYTSNYKSPLGNILLASRNNKLIGVWINNQNHNLSQYKEEIIEQTNEVLIKTIQWLDLYFNNQIPDIEIEMELNGTPFQKRVWELIYKIPYGKLTSYNEIAKIIAKERGIKKMSAQAVGQATGKNPISIIIPCHRVVGANKKLVGYGGGLDKKVYLLELEGIDDNTCIKSYD